MEEEESRGSEGRIGCLKGKDELEEGRGRMSRRMRGRMMEREK